MLCDSCMQANLLIVMSHIWLRDVIRTEPVKKILLMYLLCGGLLSGLAQTWLVWYHVQMWTQWLLMGRNAFWPYCEDAWYLFAVLTSNICTRNMRHKLVELYWKPACLRSDFAIGLDAGFTQMFQLYCVITVILKLLCESHWLQFMTEHCSWLRLSA